MRDHSTQAIEDYLKTIYNLTGVEGRATTNQIAERLGISPASVSEMLRRLSETEPQLVEYQKHRGARLTSTGERLALEVVRHHRLLEMFLHQVLGYPWDEVHEEADRLEHVISEAFEERIAQALGNPSRDPHGEPIPSRELYLPDETDLPLARLRPGDRATISRVRSMDGELLRYLGVRGLIPAANISILDYSPFDDNLEVQVEGRPGSYVIGSKLSFLIFVEPH